MRYSDTVGVAESRRSTGFVCVSETPINGNSVCNSHNSKSTFHLKQNSESALVARRSADGSGAKWRRNVAENFNRQAK